MEFNKYNYADENITIGAYNSSSNNSTSNETRSDNVTSRGGSDSRIIWGNYDDGGNIEDSMKVNGNIYIKKTSDSDDDDSDDYEWSDTEEEEEFDFDWDEDTEGGSLYVENNVKAKATEANETYGKKLFLNYPTATSPKSNVADLIKNNADNIATNTTNITNLTATVNSHTTQINANTTNISTNTTNISNNTDEIADLKERLKTLENADNSELLRMVKWGSYSHPIILYSGQIRRSTITNSKDYYIEGYKIPEISLSVVDITDGLMTLEITSTETESCYTYVGAVNVTQTISGDTTDKVDNPYIKGRSDGAHWFEARSSVTLNKTTIYIREFHQGNGDNDTWYSDNWFGEGGIKKINVTITGYFWQIPT